MKKLLIILLLFTAPLLAQEQKPNAAILEVIDSADTGLILRGGSGKLFESGKGNLEEYKEYYVVFRFTGSRALRKIPIEILGYSITPRQAALDQRKLYDQFINPKTKNNEND